MDTVQHVMYRRAGGYEGPLAWGLPPVDRWWKARERVVCGPLQARRLLA